MSVLVTTTFAHGAVFYAGETVSCTITFTNPLPLLRNPPSATSSSSSSHSKHSIVRAHPTHSHPSNTHESHSHSQSLASNSEINHGRASQNNYSINSASQEDITHAENGNTTALHSLSSLAFSTLSFFTGYKGGTTKHNESDTSPMSSGQRLHGFDATALQHETSDQNENSGAISIELGEGATPRSSADTTHSHSTPYPYMDTNRRNSEDSLVSSQPIPPHHHHQPNSPRMPHNLLQPSPPSSLAKKTVHLLWGFAQVVGSFAVDPNLINNNEFAPLKQRTMYRPHGAGMGGGGGLVMGKPDSQSKIDTRTTPIISAPPSILFVDLHLVPGETKKFSYKLKLPHDIPPSHRGKAIRFSYSLVVGTQTASASQGQVVQIPFRVLNHVSENGSQPIYDLMNPIVFYKDQAIVEPFSDNDFKKQPLNLKPISIPRGSADTKHGFLSYINELVKHGSDHGSINEITRRESSAYQSSWGQVNDDKGSEEQQLLERTCCQVVSKLTNNSRQAMFDICKNNQRVAKLHLLKTVYRLGESVMGVLDFEHAQLSTYKVSILLESTEIVEQSIALRQPQHIARISKKCYAEHHSFCLSHRRLSFSLSIPSIASPDFQTTGVTLKYHLKFEFIISQKASGSAVSASFIPINSDERHKHYQSVQDVNVSIFDCQIPIRVYGSSSGADRAIYGHPYTFSVQ